MKKMLFILLSVFVFSTMFAANKKIPKPKPTSTHLKLPAFSAVHVTGFVNVTIQGTDSKNPSDTVIESKNPQWVSAKVRSHILYLRALQAATQSKTAPTVKIRLYRLDKLDVFDRASVTGTNIKSDGLYLRADTKGTITLKGNMLVNRINNFGPGKIQIRWIKGKTVSIQSIAGHIQLAGNVDQLRIKLSNHAELDAQYLRAKHILIQTKNFAVAKVLPTQSLRAFATDFSNVYYYKTPETISRYSSRSGNILQLGQRK